MAHEEERQLQALVAALDEAGWDMFVHIDAKSPFDGSTLTRSNGRLIILSGRVDCRWGDYSLVEAELNLIDEALSQGDYSYLHLISGTDYPLSGLSHIRDFCEANSGKEFIGFSQNVKKGELTWRSGRRFLFTRDFQSKSPMKRILRKLHAAAQSLPGLGRKIDAEVKKGAQWWSITGEFARYVIERREWIDKHFRATYCPDEMVMQTLVWNSPFCERLFDTTDEFRGCMRYIPWTNGYLRPFTEADYAAMKSSDRFFGRKFTLKDIEAYERL